MSGIQRHIADTHKDREGFALCGAPAAGWAFQGIDHAFNSLRANSSVTLCPVCIRAAIKVLEAGL